PCGLHSTTICRTAPRNAWRPDLELNQDLRRFPVSASPFRHRAAHVNIMTSFYFDALSCEMVICLRPLQQCIASGSGERVDPPLEPREPAIDVAQQDLRCVRN